MAYHFSPAQQQAIRQMLGVDADQKNGFAADQSRFDLAQVQERLDLPPLPYAEYLGPESWLAGGGVLRWLGGDNRGGDFDFFFGSLAALQRTADRMLGRGFVLRGHRFLARDMAEYRRGTFVAAADGGLLGADGRLVGLSAQRVGQLRLIYLELVAPNGDAIQLVADCFATPSAVIGEFDLSICQLAADGRSLIFAANVWDDLLRNRWRVSYVKWPRASFFRMIKYARRGFWPYPSAALRLSTAFLAHKISGMASRWDG